MLCQHTKNANAIVCLGGGINPDGSLPEGSELRVEKSIELYNLKVAPYLVFSGSYWLLLPFKPPKTEAKAMKEYAIENGIPEERILLEEESQDTIGNAYFTKIKILEPKNWKSILVVCSDPQLKFGGTEEIFKKILGSDYSIDYATISSESFKEIELEKKYFEIIKPYLDKIEEGNDEQIRELLSHHPVYKFW